MDNKKIMSGSWVKITTKERRPDTYVGRIATTSDASFTAIVTDMGEPSTVAAESFTYESVEVSAELPDIVRAHFEVALDRRKNKLDDATIEHYNESNRLSRCEHMIKTAIGLVGRP